jgi:hypothetical protein
LSFLGAHISAACNEGWPMARYCAMRASAGFGSAGFRLGFLECGIFFFLLAYGERRRSSRIQSNSWQIRLNPTRTVKDCAAMLNEVLIANEWGADWFAFRRFRVDFLRLDGKYRQGHKPAMKTPFAITGICIIG